LPLHGERDLSLTSKGPHSQQNSFRTVGIRLDIHDGNVAPRGIHRAYFDGDLCGKSSGALGPPTLLTVGHDNDPAGSIPYKRRRRRKTDWVLGSMCPWHKARYRRSRKGA
jgi:hypothetical protein